ncbi:hypothetical protein FACS189461_3410 [Spirochaetia bacterium]|nr:hypothetical protein FACS189461_3410 [Spirochaetia bacterium]
MNFFDPACQESPITDIRFGLCDDKDGAAAYTDKTDESKWIAAVKNEQRMAIVFTAIDKGVIKDAEYPDRGRCDGMLASDSHLFFFELKNERQGWIEKAISQLESTIQFFNNTHAGKLDAYKHKKAFACNKKHPHFIDIDKEKVLYFFRTYRVRLDVQAEIKFK